MLFCFSLLLEFFVAVQCWFGLDNVFVCVGICDFVLFVYFCLMCLVRFLVVFFYYSWTLF